MDYKEIIRREAGKHYGFQLVSISTTSLTLSDMDIFRKLKRIPKKITAFLHRSKIKTVWKSDCFKDPTDNYYIVQASDETMFHLQY